jgi:hypothetical protein
MKRMIGNRMRSRMKRKIRKRIKSKSWRKRRIAGARGHSFSRSSSSS